MPLFDHFRPPLFDIRHWHGFHARWAVAVADDLNDRLPARYVAEVQISLGAKAEADVAEFEDPGVPMGESDAAGGTALAVCSEPTVAFEIENVFPPDCIVTVRDHDRGLRLAAALEFVSPANKDRPDTRAGFVAKVAGYLQIGAGVVVVDVVTDKHFNLHNELIRLGGHPAAALLPADCHLYAAAYVPGFRGESPVVETSGYAFSLGDELPVVPLFVRGFGTIPLELEESYSEACRRTRVFDHA